jgi:hypothetical protein
MPDTVMRPGASATYLVASVTLAACFAALSLACSPHHRKIAWLVSLLALPGAWTARLTEPSYWAPGHLAVWFVGIEDYIYAFAVGGLAWLSATWLWHISLEYEPRGRRVASRFILLYALALAVGLAVRGAGSLPMTSAICAAACCVAVVLAARPSYWRLALMGAIGFGAIHTAVVRTIFSVDPAFRAAWNDTGLWGVFVLSLPADEIAWALAFGSAWPLLAAYSVDARLAFARLPAREAALLPPPASRSG